MRTLVTCAALLAATATTTLTVQEPKRAAFSLTRQYGVCRVGWATWVVSGQEDDAPSAARQRSASLGAVLSYPGGKVFLRDAPIGKRQHFGHDFGIRGPQRSTIQAEECHDGEKADAFVSVPVRMVPDQAEAVSSRQGRKVRFVYVVPLLLRPRQRGFQGVLVADATQAAVLAKLVVVNGVNDDAAQPVRWRSASGHESLRQLSEGVSILLGGLCSNRERAFGFRIVGRQQNPAIGLDGQDTVAGFQAETIGHVFRQRGTHRTAGLSKRHFFRHGGQSSTLVLQQANRPLTPVRGALEDN